MANIQISLEDPITTDFTVFEPDQVLTATQLNTVSNYADDQMRLTRVNLVGVGVVCGLQVSLAADGTILVTKGVGVTTDGDILYYESDTVFTQYKPYDTTNPKYSYFYQGTTMIPVYQLLTQPAAGATADPAAVLLGQFGATTKAAFSDMVAVLFMESYVNAAGICSGTDCDNMGQDCSNTIKLLLIGKEYVSLLNALPGTPVAAASGLTGIFAARAAITPSITTYAQLSGAYLAACSSIQTTLSASLPKLYSACSAFLSGAFPGGDPSVSWMTLLQGYATRFNAGNYGVQYYYDFLKDVVETYNEFIVLVFGDQTVCCPDVTTFPKHLLLGDLIPEAASPNENRTPFFPSPAVSTCCNEIDHAVFLALKIDVLIRNFVVPATGADIRVTPSAFEDVSLEQRAIPYYYHWTSANQLQQSWCFRLHEQGMDTQNYSYNASLYGGIVGPFGLQIGRLPFFRVEGHIGQPVASVESVLSAQIQSMNIPIAIRKILLWGDPTFVIRRPGIRYTPLHDIHYLLRTDTYYQADDVKAFSSTFNKNVDDAIANKTITDDPSDSNATSASDVASQSNATIGASMDNVQAKLDRPYSEYVTDPSWKTDLGTAVQTAGQFKANLGSVQNTRFSTPFDSAIVNTHPNWLEWIDQMILANEAEEDAKRMFSNFVAAHPGLEHFGGALRGGTLVLLYDNNGAVVADLMLPYYYPEPLRPEPAQPLLPRPVWKPNYIIQSGLVINEKLDNYVSDSLASFKNEVVSPAIDTKFQLSTSYLNGFKDAAVGTKVNLSIDPGYADSTLNAAVYSMQAQLALVTSLNQKAADTTLPAATRAQYQAQATTAQAALSSSAQSTLQYITSSGTDVSAGSDGFDAMMKVAVAVPQVTDTATAATLATGLNQIQVSAANPALKGMIGNIAVLRAPMAAAPSTTVVSPGILAPSAAIAPATAVVPPAALNPATTVVPPASVAPITTVVSPGVLAPPATVAPATTVVPPAALNPVVSPGILAPPTTVKPVTTVIPPSALNPATTVVPPASTTPLTTVVRPVTTIIPPGLSVKPPVVPPQVPPIG